MTAAASPILTCTGVKKDFHVIDEGSAWRLIFGLRPGGPTVHALNGLSLSVPKGEFAGILGRNGAGKSTLLRVLGGVYAPTAGAVIVNGRLGSIFELGTAGSPQMTGRAYARRRLDLYGVRRADLQRYLDDIHEFSELGDSFDEPIYTYSTGMSARLFFAVATATRHDVLLIDEVLAVGDEHFQAKCWRRLRDWLAQGASGVLVTHAWPSVLRICSTAYVLDGGVFIDSGKAEEVITRYLKLVPADGAIARFAPALAAVSVVEAAADATIDVPIQIDRPIAVELAFSIEQMRVGLGWEHFILSEYVAVGRGPGEFVVSIEIPRLPLAPGSYSLNLFLATAPGEDTGRSALDVRGWTYGNGLTLHVRGRPREGGVVLPLTWQVQVHA